MMASGTACHGRRHRRLQHDASRRGEQLRAAARKSIVATAVVSDARSNAMRVERRPMCLRAFDQSAGGKTGVALFEQGLQQRIVRKLALDQHLARPGRRGRRGRPPAPRSAPGARRREIRGEQALVGVQYHHQRHLREVMALGEHLRAHQDARLATVHAADGVKQLAGRAQHVAVEALDRMIGEHSGQRFLDALVPAPSGCTSCPQRGQRSGSGASAPQ